MDCYLFVVLFCWGVLVDFKWIFYDFFLYLCCYYRLNNVMMFCCCWFFFLISYMRLLGICKNIFDWKFILKNCKKKKIYFILMEWVNKIKYYLY